MQQWWFDDGLGLKSVIYVFFYYFPLIFKVFINIHEYSKLGNLHLRSWDKRHMSNLQFGTKISSI